jgi:class 3 adenylate cyclase
LDGIFVMFEAPVRAARYALDYQSAMRTPGLASRIGLHVGEVTVRRNAADGVARGAPVWEVGGLAVSVIARLMSPLAADKGCFPTTARAMIERDVPDSARVQRRQSRSPRRSPTPKTSHVAWPSRTTRITTVSPR